jgi:hypothetical protein
MIYMGYEFRAPPKTDLKEWKRIEDGVTKGLPWQIPTKRKLKPEKKISHALRKALGIQKK